VDAIAQALKGWWGVGRWGDGEMGRWMGGWVDACPERSRRGWMGGRRGAASRRV